MMMMMMICIYICIYIYIYICMCVYIYIYVVPSISFQAFFVQAFKIDLDSRKFSMIGRINNFMDKDRRESIETISAQFDVSVGTVHNYSRVTEDAEDLHEVCPKGAQRRSERNVVMTGGI